MDDFAQKLHKNLRTYLISMGKLDTRMPECPDVEDMWETIAEAYLPDGVREFQTYPFVSLGWMMFIGMALAAYWDEDWASHNTPSLYEELRNARGYDELDEYILEDVLHLSPEAQSTMSQLVSECATLIHALLRREPIEPGTPEAFHAYVACLKELYLAGMGVQFRAMGYHMEEL